MAGYGQFSGDTLDAYMVWYANLEADLKTLLGKYQNGGHQPGHVDAWRVIGTLVDVAGDCAAARLDIDEVMREHRCGERAYAAEMAMHLRAGE